MKYPKSRLIQLLVIIGFSSAVMACNNMMNARDGSVEKDAVQLYPNDDPSKDMALVSFEKEKLNIGLPKGWQHFANGMDNDLAIKFVKDNGARLLVFCYNQSDLNSDVPDLLRAAIKKSVSNAEKIQGPWKLASSISKPYFELYKGSLAHESTEVPMDINIAWYDTEVENSCDYGLVYSAASKTGEDNTIEFLSIARSLKQ